MAGCVCLGETIGHVIFEDKWKQSDKLSAGIMLRGIAEGQEGG